MPACADPTEMKELSKRSFNEPLRFLEPSPPPVEKKARNRNVDSPYFTSQSNGEIAAAKLAYKAIDVSSSIKRTVQSSTPRLDPRDGPVSPPLLKRKLDLMASESSVTDALPLLELPGLPVRSSSSRPSESHAKDARAVRDTDLLQGLISEPRRGPSDDNSSIFSGETRLSGSTSSCAKENACSECKFKGHTSLLLIKCSTCTNRFHDHVKCISPKHCNV